MTGTVWEHQREVREALQTIVSGPQPGVAVSRMSEESADRKAPARTRRPPPAGPAPASLGHSIR